MANKYWVGGTGTWDATTTTNWSLTSGGTGGAAVPTTADVAIFDTSSNIAGSGASYTVTRTATTNVLGMQMANPSAGTLTFAGTSVIGITTSGLTISGAVNWTNTGTLTASGTTSTFNTGAITINSAIVINGNGITVTLNGNVRTGAALTLTQGTLSLGTNTFRAPTASISGTSTRTLNFGTGNLTLTGNAATIFNATTQTGLTVSGTPVINCTYSGSTGTRTITSGTVNTSLSFNVTAGSDTVVFTSGNRVNDLNFTGFTGTCNPTVTVYGNLTLATGMTTSTGAFTFASTVTGETITSAGKTIASATFNGVGGGWTLSDAMTSSGTITVTNGSFSTGNFNVTAGSISSTNSNTRSISLGSSTVALSAATPIDFTTFAGLTFSSGTSQIICSNASLTFRSGAQTFYNVSFTNSAITSAFITGSTTFNNLTFATKTSAGYADIVIPNGATINGTFSLSGTNETTRYFLISGVLGSVPSVITAATVSLSYVDFMGITAAGIIPWTGTSLGNVSNNVNITFAAGKTVYWNLAGSNNWSSNGWASTSGGAPNLSNFPLAQDTVVIDNSSAGTLITVDANYFVGGINTSTRTTAFALTASSVPAAAALNMLLDVTLSSSLTLNLGGAGFIFYGSNNQTFTPNSATINSALTCTKTLNPLVLGGTLTTGNFFELVSGTLDLSNYTMSIPQFISSNSNTRSVNFGTSGIINLTATIGLTVWNTSTVTGFSYTGTSNVRVTGNAGAVTRTITSGAPTEANSINFSVTAGAGTLTISGSNAVKNLDFTGFTGTWSNSTLTIYGSLTISTGMTVTAGTGIRTFAATSTGKTIRSNGKTLGFPIIFNGIGGEWTLQDAFTTGTTATSTVTLTYGSLVLNNFTLTCPSFLSNNSNIRFINFGTSGTIAINGTGTVWDTTSVDNLFVYGTPVVNMTNATATAKTIIPGSPNETNSISFKISGAGAATLTISANSKIRDLDFTGFTGTWSNSALTLFGSLTISTGMTVTAGTALRTFASTSTGKTIRSNGKTLGCPITFDGIGGGWTLLDAINLGSNALTLTNGSFNTSGFNVTASAIGASNSNIRSLTLGASTITLTGTGTAWNSIIATGLTLNSGTSSIVMSGALAFFQGGAQTYYNISFTSTAPTTITISGANTFNNVTFTHPAAASYVPVRWIADQTINGTLSVTGALAANRRLNFLGSSSLPIRTVNQITLTVNIISGLDDIDFANIIAAGASVPWTGTRLGDGGNNSNITYDTAKTVYWNLTGTQNWNATAWATSSGGTPADINFPLPQDTCIIDNTGAATTIAMNQQYILGNVDFSARTTAVTWNFANQYVFFNKNLILGTGVTVTNTAGQGIIFIGTTSQSFDSAGKSFPMSIFVWNSSTLSLASALTTTLDFQVQAGTFSTANFNLTCISLNVAGSTTYPATVNLGSSTVTMTSSGLSSVGSGTTFNAGTSTIVLSGASAGVNSSTNLTLYNLSVTNTALTEFRIGSYDWITNVYNTSPVAITCSNNFTVTGRSGAVGVSRIYFGGCSTFTVGGTMTINAGTSVIYRTVLYSESNVTTISAAAVGTFTDIDFHNITAAGASSPWSGTRLGDAAGNSNITFPAAKTVFWNLTGTQNWSSTAWATTSNGTPALNNFPLAHDIASFTNTGVSSTLTYNANWYVGTVNFSSRTTSSTLAGTGNMNITGNLTLYTGLTVTYTGIITCLGTGTQNINSVGRTLGSIIETKGSGTVSLAAALTTTGAFRLYTGTLDLNTFTLSAGSFNAFIYGASSSILFGTGTINLTGNSITVLNYENGVSSYLTMTGTPTFNLTYSGAVGTRSVSLSDSNITTVNVNVTAGIDGVSMSGSVNNLNLTGYTGSSVQAGISIHGNFNNGLSNASSSTDGALSFIGSADQTITMNGTTSTYLFTILKPSGKVTLNGNLTLIPVTATASATAQFKLQQGIVDLNGFTLTTPSFSSNYTNIRTLTSNGGSINVTGRDKVFGTVSYYAFEIDSTNLTYTTPPNITFSNTAGTFIDGYTTSFYGGGMTYGTVTFKNNFYVYDNNTFNILTNSASPSIVLFEGGSTQTFTSFNVNGISNVRTYLTSTNTSQYTLIKAAAWNMGANSDDEGNNTNIFFVAGSVDYLNISYMIGVVTGGSNIIGQFFAFF